MEDFEQSKVFVGGISWETTEDVLRSHFGKYGTVVGSVIAKDRISGTPRGFAFVSFSDASALDKVLLDTHTILGRTVEVKKAVPRNEHNQNHQEHNRGSNRNGQTNGWRKSDNLKTKKIFVGGLSANLTEEEFKIYFEKFGRITDVVVMHDNVTHRPRGFGFITFDSEDSVEEVMQKSFHELSGKLVEVKRAVPKEVSANNGFINNFLDKDSNFSDYQHGNYYPYSPRFEMVHGYGSFPGYGGYPYGGGAYTIGGYGGFSYGLGPRGPWSGPAMVSPLPYGGPVNVYPGYLNGGHGFMGMAANGYNGVVGPVPHVKPSQLSGHDVRAGNIDNGMVGYMPNGRPSQLGGGGCERARAAMRNVDRQSSQLSGDNERVRANGKSSQLGGGDERVDADASSLRIGMGNLALGKTSLGQTNNNYKPSQLSVNDERVSSDEVCGTRESMPNGKPSQLRGDDERVRNSNNDSLGSFDGESSKRDQSS